VLVQKLRRGKTKHKTNQIQRAVEIKKKRPANSVIYILIYDRPCKITAEKNLTDSISVVNKDHHVHDNHHLERYITSDLITKYKRNSAQQPSNMKRNESRERRKIPQCPTGLHLSLKNLRRIFLRRI
jgi:hypothetical protein